MARRLTRFTAVERAAHWLTAALFITLIITGAFLYVPQLVGFIGRRLLIERIHVYAGLALPVPLIISLAGPWGKALRADMSRLNRWSNTDRRWLAGVLRRQPVGHLRLGKFNAGQKLNAAFTLGVMGVMLMTGVIMHWFYLWPLSWRSGATFVHDLVAYLFVVAVLAHVTMALTHPQSLRSMFFGWVSRAWAKRHAAVWLEEVESGTAGADGGASKAG